MKIRLNIVVLLLCLGSVFVVQRWIDDRNSNQAAGPDDETLYFTSGSSIKKVSLGFEPLIADIYWIRTVQYFGRKLLEADKPVNISNLSDIPMDSLVPLLNIVVELDPHHIAAYR